MDKENSFFHHAFHIDSNNCIGCSKCMSICPTESIRIRGGKAIFDPNKCIDCGKCYDVCMSNAIKIEEDDFNEIFKYKRRIALIPSVFLGQFKESISVSDIYSYVLSLGFTDVFEAENSANILKDNMNKIISETKQENKPLISSFCPAVIRLIQVKYPTLTDNIIPLKSPLELTAIYLREKFKNELYKDEEIGIFYITPCAAKIAAIKAPVGDKKSGLDGVINMDTIFSKVYREAVNNKSENLIDPKIEPLDKTSIKWSLTRGEANCINARALAIDGLENIIEFLDNLEIERHNNIDYLELRACYEGCAGGVLSSANRFLVVERMNKRANKLEQRNIENPDLKIEIEDYRDFLNENIRIHEPICPRPVDILDKDIETAISKMILLQETMDKLPDINCGACGSPSCKALAQDIVNNEATIDNCVFIQKKMLKNNEIHKNDVGKNIENIWGEKVLKDNKKKIDK